MEATCSFFSFRRLPDAMFATWVLVLESLSPFTIHYKVFQSCNIVSSFLDNQFQFSLVREAGFHILITSYQLLVSDEKYFRRVKWQYMVLDEAQAIKSSNRFEVTTLRLLCYLI